MDILDAIILGIIQGITEWLPVSSSGHLALAQHYFGIDASVAFDIVLHLGTLLAVFIYYRNDILSLAKGVLARDANSLRFASLIIAAAIPTAIIGLLLKDFFESMFASPLSIAIALSITGIFLILSSWISSRRLKAPAAKTRNAEPGTASALIIGIVQGIAVAPGISRSGATIGTALLLGIGKEEAARFSFLAGIIPILGAAVLEGRHAVDAGIDVLPALAGFATAAIAGYLSIGLLLRLLKESRFQWFGYYCLLLSAAVCIIVILA